MEYSIYICPKCKKIYKAQGSDKKIKCTQCSVPLADSHVSTDEWAQYSSSRKEEIKNKISNTMQLEPVKPETEKPKSEAVNAKQEPPKPVEPETERPEPENPKPSAPKSFFDELETNSTPEPNIGARNMVPKPDRTLAIVISICTAVITLTLVTMIILFKPWADKDRQQETETEMVMEENAEQEEEPVEEAAEGDSENESPITEAEEEYFDWKTAYTDYIADNDLLSCKFALICLDEDNIPEIFINTGMTSSDLYVLTCYKGEVSKCEDLSSHSQYVPGEGLICSTTGQMGNYPLRIVKLQDGQFNEIATGSCEEEYDFDNGTSTEHYYWGGHDKGEISAEEYNAHIAEYIDEGKSRTLSEDDFSYYYDTLCDKLREWADEGGAGQNTLSTSGKGSTGYDSSNKEQMYRDISDMFGQMTVWNGGNSLGISEYEGDPDGCFFFQGDGYESYREIRDFRDNTVFLESCSLRCVTPWMVEYKSEDHIEDCMMLSGYIEEIDNAMKTQDVPEFIFPDSDHVKIDVYSNLMNYDVVRLAKNEIFARHGRKFKDARLQAYFDARSWYKGTIEPDKFNEDVLNETEKENVLQFSEWEQLLKHDGLDKMR